MSPSPPADEKEDTTMNEAGQDQEKGGEGQEEQSPASHASSETAAAGPSAEMQVEATTNVNTDAPAEAAPSNQETADNDIPSEANPAAKKRTICGVCNKEPSKYKCSRCPLAYCSVACSRIHRDNHPPDAPAEKDDKKDEKTKAGSTLPGGSGIASLPPKPTPPPHPFQVLDDAPELKRLFEKYPTLPARLQRIYEATQPPKQFSKNKNKNDKRKAAIPGMPAGAAVNTNNGQNWTTEKGLRQGQKALKRARCDPGEDGDAVREYCETVTYLLAREAGDFEGSGSKGANTPPVSSGTKPDGYALVREELAVEANEVIKKLLDAEGRS